jgi:hypothetical protein
MVLAMCAKFQALVMSMCLTMNSVIDRRKSVACANMLQDESDSKEKISVFPYTAHTSKYMSVNFVHCG